MIWEKIWEELKSRKNFVEEDFIELRDSVEELISVIEKYKDMGYNSSLYIDDLKDYYVYDKNNLEKTHKANDEIEIAKKRFEKILYKITEKVKYHMI